MVKEGATATSCSLEGSEWTLRKIFSVALEQVLPDNSVAFLCLEVLKILVDTPAADLIYCQ